MTTEEAIVLLPGNFQHFRAHRVDADTTRHIHRGTDYKSIKRTISRGRAGTTGDRVAIQHAAGNRERSRHR